MAWCRPVIHILYTFCGIICVCSFGNRTLNALTGAMLRQAGKKGSPDHSFFMVLFAIGGTTIGMYAETYGLIPAFMIIAVTLGL